MRQRIKDEFTRLAISRQRKYQLRKKRDQCCTECGEPAVAASRCLKHLVVARERQRNKRGLKRRYYSTVSYQLEAMAGLRPARILNSGGREALTLRALRTRRQSSLRT